MSKENINNSEITNKELIESIEEEIDGKIKKKEWILMKSAKLPKI